MAITALRKTVPIRVAILKRINKNGKNLLISYPRKDNGEAGWHHLEQVHSITEQLVYFLKKHSTILQIETQRRTTVPIRTKPATLGHKTTGGIPVSIPEKYCHLLSTHIAHSKHDPGDSGPV